MMKTTKLEKNIALAATQIDISLDATLVVKAPVVDTLKAERQALRADFIRIAAKLNAAGDVDGMVGILDAWSTKREALFVNTTVNLGGGSKVSMMDYLAA